MIFIISAPDAIRRPLTILTFRDTMTFILKTRNTVLVVKEISCDQENRKKPTAHQEHSLESRKMRYSKSFIYYSLPCVTGNSCNLDGISPR